MLFRVERDRAAFLDALAARGVMMVAYPHGQVRAATHYGVTAADIETTIAATRAALSDVAETADLTDATNGTEAAGGARTAVTTGRDE